MKTALAFALLFAFLLFFSGCFTPNMQGPCCRKADVLNGTCKMYPPPGPDPSQPATEECSGTTLPNGLSCNTEYCVLANASKEQNQTIFIKYTAVPGGTPQMEILNCTNVSLSNKTDPCNNVGYCLLDMVNASKGCASDADCGSQVCINGKCGAYASYPVCTDREVLSFDTECKTMLCGNIKYSPKTSLLPDATKDPSYQNLGAPYTLNLYNAMCDFYLLDNQTMRKLKKGTGIFVNTYRYGLGTTISDYEEGRLYYPLSDRWCGFMPEEYAIGGKDRYVNYLNLSDCRGTGCGKGGRGTTEGEETLCNDYYLRGRINTGSSGNKIFQVQIYGNERDDWDCDESEKNEIIDIVGKDKNYTSLVCNVTNPTGAWPQIIVEYPNWTRISPNGNCDPFENCPYDKCDPFENCPYTFNYKCAYSEDGGEEANESDFLYFGPFDPSTLRNRSTAVGCGDDYDFPPAAAHSYIPQFNIPEAPKGNFILNTYTEGSISLLGKGKKDFLTNYTLPDVFFYRFALQGAYWDSIYNTSANASPVQEAPFECNSSLECISGLCAKQDFGYKRSFCTIDGNTSINCLCYEQGQRKQPGNHVMCLPYEDDATFTPAFATVGGKKLLASPIIFYNRYTLLLDEVPGENGTVRSYMMVPDENMTPENRTVRKIIGYAIMDESNFTNSVFYKKCELTPGSYITRTCCMRDNKTPMDCGSIYADYPSKECCTEPGTENETETSCPAGTNTTKIYVQNMGECLSDARGDETGIKMPTFPKLIGTYGWCEPCSFATMVGINLDDYWKRFQGRFHGTTKNDGSYWITSLDCPDTACDQYVASGFTVGIWDYLENCQQCGGKIREYIANVGFLRTRIDNYLKAGVMPVIWYVDGELNYTNVKSGGDHNINDNGLRYYQICQDTHTCTNYNDSEDCTAAAENKIKETLTGNMFYYFPDMSPFFEDVSADCRITSSDCGTGPLGIGDTCNGNCNPVAASPPSSPLLGEFGISTANDYAPEAEAITLEDKGNMYCRWVGKYHFLGRAIGNSASIVIVATDNMSQDKIAERARLAKSQGNCPKCLTALYSPNADIEKLKGIFGCDGGETNCLLKHNSSWQYIDVIAYDFRENDYSGGSREQAIVDAETGISRTLLQKFGKPSFAYNFVIDDSANNWQAYNDTYNSLSYVLFRNQTDLVNSGMFAFFYKKWYEDSDEALTTPTGGTRPPSVKDAKFCGVERAVNLFLNPMKTKTIVNRIPAVDNTSSQGYCEKRTQMEIALGLPPGENKRMCENGVNCTLPPDADPDDVNADLYKCPSNTAIEPCASFCNESGIVLTCNRTWSNDTVETGLVYNFSEIFSNPYLNPDAYGDIIASVPKNARCCLHYFNEESNESYNYTFSKTLGEGLSTTPVRYPRSGSETLDCGLTKESTEESTSFCGVQLPVRDYKIECAVSQ